MKVCVEREVDVQRLLINLNEKSQCKDPGMAGYSVTVDKQLLRDAHDVIVSYIQQEDKPFELPKCFGHHEEQKDPNCGPWCRCISACQGITAMRGAQDETKV